MNKFTSQWPVRNFVCQQFYSGKYLMHVQEFQKLKNLYMRDGGVYFLRAAQL